MYRGEFINSISHLVGAAFALIGATVLITVAALEGDPVKIISYSVYGTTLVLLFLSSTLYHSFAGSVKRIFQKLDHQAIYLLIAGTYTPFALVAVQGASGWWLFGVIWGLAATGMVLDALPSKGPRVVPVIIYLVMGWSCIFVLDPIISALPPAGVWFLVGGGLFYTSGIIFYVLDRWYSWCHPIWHLFVLAGSACHYFAIFML